MRPDKVKFIAEISSNHNRDLARCRSLVDAAADIGCDAVKFQYFRIPELYEGGFLAKHPELGAQRAWELPEDFLGGIADRCHRRHIAFGCTAFSLGGVKDLQPHVDFYKVASLEILRHDLIAACARTKKPVIVSTGASTLEEVRDVVTLLRRVRCRNFALMHCVSCYPAPLQQCNLASIRAIRASCGCRVGWSDHTASSAVIYRAVHHWGAGLVEFHLDLEGKGAEFGFGHCWLPARAGKMIRHVREGFLADGHSGKAPMPCEARDMSWRSDPEDGMRPLKEARHG